MPFLETRNTMTADEFLFLICNTIPRMQFFDKIPKQRLNIERAVMQQNSCFNSKYIYQKFLLFYVETTDLQDIKNPDEKMQSYMKFSKSANNLRFEGKTKDSKEECYT